jgi:hypothetical protein
LHIFSLCCTTTKLHRCLLALHCTGTGCGADPSPSSTKRRQAGAWGRPRASPPLSSSQRSSKAEKKVEAVVVKDCRDVLQVLSAGTVQRSGRLLQLPPHFSPPRFCHASQGKAHQWIWRGERVRRKAGAPTSFAFSMLASNRGTVGDATISFPLAFFACGARSDLS